MALPSQPVAATPIVVAGDVCADWFTIPVARPVVVSARSADHAANWQLRDGVRVFTRPGGAWMLASLVSDATQETVRQQPVPSALEQQDCNAVLRSIIELK